MEKRKKIYYLLATQHGNMGDLLINKMLIDELTKYGDVYVDCAGVNDKFKEFIFKKKNVYSANDYFNASLKRISFFKVLFQMKEFEYFFRTPGPNVRILNFKSLMTQVYMCFIYSMMYNKKKIFQVGTDFVIKSNLEYLTEKYCNKFLSCTYVRSEKDVEDVVKKGFNNVTYMPDLAFLLETNFVTAEKDKVLISFRDLNDAVYTQQIISFLENTISLLVKKNIKVCFFYQVDSDEKFNIFLYEKFKREGVILNSKCLWYDQIDIYANTKYVISNRLHVLLLGQIYNSISIGILNSNQRTNKIFKIFSSLGFKETFLNPVDFNYFEKNYDSISTHIKDVVERNLEICREKIAFLIK